ncbi:hypothetical protein SAMN02745945_01683 [Peptoclostridium litorale DSM 5388]|uniref:SIMPL domain-containing protein n=1 Tax=Peptoclostridium litorale DSM 5388 TaxID=1121324 RepID=A0A069RGA0_PEPLI|nr:SIMPL domain-containing protein [Peptoclostridium litorale]KDR96041.1 hypothetical protein CLIT_5c00530 [Peptoclostridium litorale DSM 5388]SIO06024.1 hypothetical protein SAMN02745945_01683 [Peptoclostridium litorale DSM 5388]
MENGGKNKAIPVAALMLSVALIISSIVVMGGFVKVKSLQNTLSVKGSAKKQIKSDFAVWTGSFSVQSSELSNAYGMLSESAKKVKEYLVENGVPEQDIVFSAINTSTYNEILPNGVYTNRIESYRLYQNVEINSNDIDKITQISRKSTELINEGVEFQSNSPQYFYTKLSDLKLEMIELAAQDSKQRAQKLLSVTGNKPGKLRSARLGVFQITPLYSNEVSDYGINDTTSIEKEITAVVSCEFEVN